MQFSVYLNSENIEDAVLENSFVNHIKALAAFKCLPFFRIYALASSFEVAKAAMREETQVMGALTMLLRLVESKREINIHGSLFEVNPTTGESTDARGVPSRMRLPLFADTTSNHVSAFAFIDTLADRHICMLYNNYVKRPEAKIYLESGNPWRLLVEAFVEAILPEHWGSDDLADLFQTDSFQYCLSEATQRQLHEYDSREIHFETIMPNHALAAFLRPNFAQAARKGSTEDRIAHMKILSVHYAFVNGWFENHHLSVLNNRKIFSSIFPCSFLLALDTKHFDWEVHDKSNGSHYGSFSLPDGQLKAPKAHKLLV
jgi:hypothetical protein